MPVAPELHCRLNHSDDKENNVHGNSREQLFKKIVKIKRKTPAMVLLFEKNFRSMFFVLRIFTCPKS